MTLLYTGSKYNTQELSAAELLSNLEADGAAEHGDKVLHALDSRRRATMLCYTRRSR